MITEQQVDAALDYLRDTAKEAAQARANVTYTAEWLKVVRAKAKAKQVGVSNAAAEDIALTSDDYREAIEAHCEAVRQDSEYRFLREAASAKIAAFQTFSANQRAEQKAYG